ncbi:hypothetical protein BKI52_19960 [marine bacterium AO1-C]|nr:hypothetical protein BKI52_19960 [marine bacterium AO1-C]
MKTVYNTTTIQELTQRVDKIQDSSKAQWGKMNAYQMLIHCVKNEEMLLGKRAYKRNFIGKIFGKMTLKSILKDNTPLKKNQPTHPDLIITGQGSIEQPKQQWIALIKEYGQLSANQMNELIHPFFGKMTHEKLGKYAYKHIDHHLRQFGV